MIDQKQYERFVELIHEGNSLADTDLSYIKEIVREEKIKTIEDFSTKISILYRELAVISNDLIKGFLEEKRILEASAIEKISNNTLNRLASRKSSMHSLLVTFKNDYLMKYIERTDFDEDENDIKIN